MIASPVTITVDNLIAVLGDLQQRSRLQRAINKEHGTDLPLSNRYLDLARTCRATPDQLHAVVKAMLPFRRRYQRLICGLVFHPHMPDQTLLLLLEKRRCLTELGHRPGPQCLLERIAVRYRYSEAITTLALRYYSQPEYPADAFAAFLQEHADHSMLRQNLTRATTGLPPDKQDAVRRVFGTPEEAE